MKPLLLFSLTLMLWVPLSAQKKQELVKRDASGKTIEEYAFPYIPNIISIDCPGSFIKWQGDKPGEFSFELFDRWGTLLVSSTQYDFNLNDLLKEKKDVRLKEGVYVYRILFTLPNGEKKKIAGHGNYIGTYCGCG